MNGSTGMGNSGSSVPGSALIRTVPGSVLMVMGTCLEGDSGANSFPFEANLIRPIPSMLHLFDRDWSTS